MVDATDTILRVSREFDESKSKKSSRALVGASSSRKRKSSSTVSKRSAVFKVSDEDDDEVCEESDTKRCRLSDASETVSRSEWTSDQSRNVTTSRPELSTYSASNKNTNFPIPRYEIVPYDEFNYFSRLLGVLTYSDRHGRWIGIQSFLDLYFSTIFNIFFGNNFEIRVVHIFSDNKFSAKFSLYNLRAYKIIVLMNYAHWDHVLETATAMPDIYFRPSVGITSTISLRDYYDGCLGGEVGRFFDTSVMALCLVHRLEMLMFSDIRAVAPHVVTLGRFFANDSTMRNPFVVREYYNA